MQKLETLDLETWTPSALAPELIKRAAGALEDGKVLFLPHLAFILSAAEKQFLSPEKADPKYKNVGYDIRNDRIAGHACEGEEKEQLKALIRRYAEQSRKLIDTLFPSYSSQLKQARTSFRPCETAGRKSSYRKDDTRLHVDAFPASPVKGLRILRCFTNVNPHGKPRVWRLGEPFPEVVKKIAPRIRAPFPGVSTVMKALGLTKDYRTPYDHYMLKIHNAMKGDLEYQKTVQFQEVLFPPGSTWIVFSDQVSHAAMAGQFLFEQTYYLPPEAQLCPEKSPLKVLEKQLQRSLV